MASCPKHGGVFRDASQGEHAAATASNDQGLEDRHAFPFFTDLPGLSADMGEFYEVLPGPVWRKKRAWCFIGEIEEFTNFLARYRYSVRTFANELLYVALYPDNQIVPPRLAAGVNGSAVGRTLAILDVHSKIFADGSMGIRAENMDSIYEFNCGIEALDEEIKKIRPLAQQRCFNCNGAGSAGIASLNKCGQCLVAVYCGRECQRAHWAAVHKNLCKQMKFLVGMLDIVHSPCRAQPATFTQIAPL